MRTFVSVADVDGLLGEAWVAPEAKDRAVLMANVWLGNQGLSEIEPTPNAWKQAGVEIAKEAAAGKLYAATETGVLSKAADADGVSVSKTFSATAQNLSAGEVLALALIRPWLAKRSGVMMLKRV